jgi:Ser/Thr protein kinase RdoA (MazF antagonist)
VEQAFASRLQVVEAAVLSLAYGRTMPTVRIHGDLHVDNVFFDSRSVVLSGLIDWETSLPVSLPFDLIHYLISDSTELDPKPWGIQVARAFSGELFDPEANELLLEHLELLKLPADMLRPLLIGYWVRGVALRQALSGGRLDPMWRDANLAMPLASIEMTLAEVQG